MVCKMCKERGKTWEGSDPKCYFDNPEYNWNCATVNAIRDIFTPEGWWIVPDKLPKGLCATFGEDTTYGLICLQDIEFEGEQYMDGCLYVQWYKRRGATEALWIVAEDRQFQPRRPTEKELLTIIKYYEEAKCIKQ
jgi:hypothetical protein